MPKEINFVFVERNLSINQINKILQQTHYAEYKNFGEWYGDI